MIENFDPSRNMKITMLHFPIGRIMLSWSQIIRHKSLGEKLCPNPQRQCHCSSAARKAGSGAARAASARRAHIGGTGLQLRNHRSGLVRASLGASGKSSIDSIMALIMDLFFLRGRAQVYPLIAKTNYAIVWAKVANCYSKM
jgi:hypothetical protein